MKFQISPYELSSSRRGALLKFFFEDGFGFADVHPWEEWGDDPLNVQIEKLKKGEMTLLTERAAYFAKLDYDARREKKSLFEGKKIPQSRHLLTDFDSKTRFPNCPIKVKLKGFSQKILNKPPGVKVVFDFNRRLTHERFIDFLEKVKPLWEDIDYIEDPFPFDPELWKKIMETYPVKLALDQNSEKGIGLKWLPYLILKPARQDEKAFAKAKGQKIVVTSMLDHPLGQCSAAFIASSFNKELAGLLSHRVYPSTPFSEEIETSDYTFKPPVGTGFGFDKLLKKVPWHEP